MEHYNNIKNKIKEKGYIKITFEPADSNSERLSFDDISTTLDTNLVRLRGWSYPMIPPYDRAEGEIFKRPYNVGSGKAYYSDFEDRKEVGVLFKSGQFISMVSIIEDYMPEYRGKDMTKIKYFDFLSLIYKITEIILFIKKYTESRGINGGNLKIELGNMNKRLLDSIFSFNIFPFSAKYESMIETIAVDRKISREEILSDDLKVSRSIIIEIFQSFNWDNPSESMIETHQNNLMTGRI